MAQGADGSAQAPTGSEVAAYVEREVCASCHESEMAALARLDHDLAMQEATAETVLGDFDAPSFSHGRCDLALLQARRQVLRHHRRAGRRARRLRDPLHLRRLPAATVSDRLPDGRLQALASPGTRGPKIRAASAGSISTPTRSSRPAIRCTGPGSTRPGISCAPSATRPSCTRTTMRRGQLRDGLGRDRRRLRGLPWSRLGSRCLGGAAAELAAWGKGGDDGSRSTSTSARASTGRSIRDRQRRAQRAADQRQGARDLRHLPLPQRQDRRRLAPGPAAPRDPLPALLQPGLFEADGKMLDEVYNYASFRQSKMFTRGVTCSDCHEPHSLELRAEGNGVCYQCHDEAKYDVVAHHHHAEGSPARAAGVSHAGAHVHGGRPAPRSRLSRPAAGPVGALWRPNSCNDCHADQDAAGRRPRSSAGTGRTARAFRPGPRRSLRSETTRRKPGRVAAARERRGDAGDRARHGARGPRAAPEPRGGRRGAARSGRCRPAGQAGGAAHASLAAGRAELAARAWPARRSGAGRPLEAASLLAAMPRMGSAGGSGTAGARDRGLRGGAAAERRPARSPGQSGQSHAQQGQPRAAEAEYLAAARSTRLRAGLRHARPALRPEEPDAEASGCCAKRWRHARRGPSCTWRSA